MATVYFDRKGFGTLSNRELGIGRVGENRVGGIKKEQISMCTKLFNASPHKF